MKILFFEICISKLLHHEKIKKKEKKQYIKKKDIKKKGGGGREKMLFLVISYTVFLSASNQVFGFLCTQLSVSLNYVW